MVDVSTSGIKILVYLELNYNHGLEIVMIEELTKICVLFILK